MPHFALSELVLMVCALYGVSRIFRLPYSLPALIGLLLLAITAGVASARYGLSLQRELASIHGLYSSLSASVGMILILVSFISLKTPALLSGNRQWLTIVMVTIIFGAAAVLQFVGPLVTIATLLAITATIAAGGALFNEGQRSLGAYAIISGLLFLWVGSMIGSRGDDLLGFLPRWHAFHLAVACWCLAVALSFRNLSGKAHKAAA
ncbi:hypothetical protein ACH42_00385 [Endozoicomonas sp. (ex Bugula neritina AB1)]|nr:hypothetical protein ACH42_00385 [Endozoicomonas sp. (ex Bugula neritina AB1)]